MNANPENPTPDRLSRRGLLATAAGTVAAAAAAPALAQNRHTHPSRQAAIGRAVTKGRINQSVCEWCFVGDNVPKPMSLEELVAAAAAMGVKSVELVQPENWDLIKKHGLICALANSHWFVDAWSHKENHPLCKEKIIEAVDACAAAGFPSVITFSGSRKGIPDDVGLENTVEGLKTVVGHAEKNKVNLILEVLNGRVAANMMGHPDYMGDSVEWCVEVCKRVGSERLKILFDIYHVQIMQGDIISRIKQYKDYIGHYHTAGVPGRHELDDNQELNYPPVMRAIAETGFTGYVGQEFIPTRDPLRSLWDAVKLCDV